MQCCFWLSSVDSKSAWAGNDSYVLLSRVGPYKLFYKDLRISPGRELESEVHISLILTDKPFICYANILY